MIASLVHKTPAAILDKLIRLLNALQTVKGNYEETALRIRNKQLRLSLLALAQESKQYANELMAHIETLGGKLDEQVKTDFNRMGSDREDLRITEGMDLRELNLGEQLLMKTYRDILNEPFLYDNVRRIVRYQLNGLMHCFSQLKMLYATLRKTSVDGI
jgi:1,2-phenylacetyl-CoA epoxidase catalytic subunit